MARKKVREYDAKRVLKAAFARLLGVQLPIVVAQVKEGIDFGELLQQNPWLSTTKLVVKPDMLFGQRGKHDLLGINLDYGQAQTFIKERLNRVVTVNECTGPITTFVIEPFQPHKEEYYLSVQSDRLGYEILFCEAGGVDIEEHWDKLRTREAGGLDIKEHWDKLRTIKFDTLDELNGHVVAPLISMLPMEVRPQLEAFIIGIFKVFLDLDATLLEMNPFTLIPMADGAPPAPFPLDIRLELDDTARFRSAPK
ncbi:hypothetical protein FOA52_004031 [Chlamydomonas sp. UWO 241]|nr:hypothetical protein FOA52_004031 [Chlamydomonas sp. UWO 241]